VCIERTNCFEAEGRLVEAAAEAQRVVDKYDKFIPTVDAQWMQALANTLVGVAKVDRWRLLVQVRQGGLNSLADRREYALLAGQAHLLPQSTGERPADSVSAQALAYAAVRAANSQPLEADKRSQSVETLAADAVRHLQSAWEGGYLRRSAGLAGMFSSAPTLK